AIVMSALLSPGDHLLISDNAYTPTKMWAETYGKRMNISFDMIHPDISEAELENAIQDNTKLIMLESPGSLTFEIADVPMITHIAHKHDIAVAIDNTWGAGVYFDAFKHGCDISIQAGTKYFIGHSDACFGTIACNKKYNRDIKITHKVMGQNLDGDTAFLALRGIRTLYVRLEHHMRSALKVAEFLENHPKIDKVLHPGLESSKYHALWKRDFTGACGLFSFTLKDNLESKMQEFIDALELFGLGFSWGGFESLVMPCLSDNLIRATQSEVASGASLIRINIGLENVDDLIADLTQALEKI
ncbi:MAG: PLP-dependent aspartate aminotransferase family protein, partial [Pseudomonadota bacterium]